MSKAARKPSRFSRAVTVCGLGVLLTWTMFLFASPGEADELTGLTFLKIGVGARAVAMGSAHVAVVRDATSLYWNPAGLALVEGLDLHLSHNEWFQDVRYEFLSIAKRWGAHGFGAGFSGLYMDELERRDESGNFLGHFGYYDVAVWTGWGMNVKPGVFVGTSVKMLIEQIDDVTATGFAVDLGTRYETPVPNLALGFGVFNVGPKMKFLTEEFDVPRSLSFGASYALPIESWSGDLLMAADAVLYKGEDMKAHVGAEYGFKNLASLGLGYKFGYDLEGFSVGAGVFRGPLRFGYAYSVMGSDVGDAHRVSLSYTLY
ncbi:MAG: PorV/PorQ family protein [Candidatus Eiseniibacteriota bacterium]|nr:MAG: PorV/PorQ family protein [Candidatus Eisenbacteria bacterium]